jgi:hypothetical protein
MAHQFDSVCGNEPMQQIMIQLIGCSVTTSTSQPIDDPERLNEAPARYPSPGKERA